jgi:hypothetical protein
MYLTSRCISHCLLRSCTLLAASLVVDKGRLALLALLGVVNVAIVATFLYHIVKQFWLWVGAPASKAIHSAYSSSRSWWTQKVTSKLAPKLRAWCQWPPAWLPASWRGPDGGGGGEGGSRGVGVGSGVAATTGRVWERVRGLRWWVRGSRKAQQQQQQQEQDKTKQQQQQQANGHAPMAARQGKDQKQEPSGVQQQQQDQQMVQQELQQANGSAAPAVQANQHATQADSDGNAADQQQQANGHAPQLQANGSAPAAAQQPQPYEQQQRQQPPSPPHNIHQIM